MVWDLRGALLKKAERESARLLDFAWAQRARAAQLLAERLGEAPEVLARAVAQGDDAALLAALAARVPERAAELPGLLEECTAEARRQLLAERGNPAPVRLL